MMLITRKAIGSLAALGLVVGLAGCGGPTVDNKSDGTLTIGVPTIPATLDPGQNFLRQEYAIMNLTAGTLTTVNDDGKGTGLGIAESVEAGDNRFVVKLKPNLKFSDGTALTSTDVVASFNHYLTDATNGYAYTFAPIDKVTAADDLTVNFDLKRPYPALPFFLALPTSAILPSEPLESNGEKKLYQGAPLPTAGKFGVKSFSQDEITLEANPNYNGSQPSTKTLVFKKIVDPAARLAQVQGGEIDFADEISPKALTQLTAPVEPRTTIGVNGTQFLSLNTRDSSVLNDVRIRQAIARSVDRKQINQVAWSGKNQTARGLFANGSQYSKPFLPETPELGRAKDLLAGTKCESGCTLQLSVNSADEPANDVAVVVQQNLKELGITVNINRIEPAALSQQGIDGNFDILVSFSYEVGDVPDGLLSFLFGPSVSAMYSGYSSATMNQLLDTVGTSQGTEKAAAVEQVNALFEKDLPLVPFADVYYSSASRVPSSTFDTNPTFFYHVG